MKDTNNLESNSSKNSITNIPKSQEKTTSIKRQKEYKELTINLATGQGITSVQLKQNTHDYNTLKECLTSFNVVTWPYSTEVTIKGKPTTLSQDKAIEYAHKMAKNQLSWFIAGKFDPATRHTENLLFRSAIVLDLDSYDKNLVELEKVVKKELSKFKYIAYSTASHTPTKPKIRIVIFLEKNIPAGEYEQVARCFASTLSFQSAIDAASFKPNQFMYISGIVEISNLPDGATLEKYQPWILENDGNLLKPSKFKQVIAEPHNNTAPKKPKLSLVQNISKAGEESSKIPPVESEEEKQKSTNLTEAEIADSLVEYNAADLLYNEWLEVGMALHHYYKGESKGLDVFDNWSKHDTKRYEPEEIKSKWKSFNNNNCGKVLTFLTVLKRIKDKRLQAFNQEIIKLIAGLKPNCRDEEIDPIIKAIAVNCSKTEAEYYLNEIKQRTNLSISILRKWLAKQKRKIAIEQMEKMEKEQKRIYPLHKALPAAVFSDYLDDESNPKHTIENLEILLKCYGIIVRRNEISNTDEIIIPNISYINESIDNAALARLTSLCKMNDIPETNLLGEYCCEIGARNHYNPLSEWIKSKPWDGRQRIHEFFNTITAMDGFNRDDKDFFIRKWLISGVAAMEEKNGVFSKGVLVFQGKQSLGKTSWFKKLLPEPVREYFLEGATLDPNNKDSKATALCHAIVELGELDSTMKKDIAAIKAFLSSNRDQFRFPYAKRDSRLPRRTIFCASVNADEFLVDTTGNSRFWSIPVEKIDYQHNIDMQQLWAEVLELYNAGEKWWLTPEEEKVLEKYNRHHVKTCPYREMIVEKYYIPQKGEVDKDRVNQQRSASQILVELDLKVGKVETNAVVSAMKELGAIRSSYSRKFTVRLINKDIKNSENNSYH